MKWLPASHQRIISNLFSVIYLFFFLFISSCREKPSTQIPDQSPPKQGVNIDSTTIAVEKTKFGREELLKLADTSFVRLSDFSADFVYDLRYATTNNFLKAQVYDCAECYTRAKTAKALIAANEDFMNKGYKIKFFDCYRPNSVQYKMWEIVPNPQYVANPVKGSIHNKGGAVDITLVTLEGEELDMGTDFDYFGKRAYHDNTDLPNEILNNRKLLKSVMETHGFWSIRTEWWHYNLSSASNDAIADFKWKCE